MRRLLLLTAFVLFLPYCQGDKQATQPAHEHPTDAATTGPATTKHEDRGGSLALNNGQKWTLDAPTRKNIGEIKRIVDQAAAQPRPNYRQLAVDLQAATDKLIGQCRMSGPDHDALHLWLQDYLPALKELHSTNKSMQKNAFHTIRSEAKQFDQYFR